MIINQEDFFQIKMKFIEEEIDIRVESIKNEIEKAGQELKGRLNKMKNEFKKYQKKTIIKIVFHFYFLLL